MTASPQQGSTFYIWDDPGSKIQFLEHTLRDTDWRATIICPDDDPKSTLERQQIKSVLEARGYIVKEEIDDCGYHNLKLHHIGDGTELNDMIAEAGLVKGVMHIASHPYLPLRYMVRAAKDTLHFFKTTVKDPARANGFINSMAEVVLLFSGTGNKYGDFSNPKNALQSISAAFWLGQSLTYLLAAKTNDEIAFKELKTKVDRTVRHGGDFTSIRYDPQKDKKHGVGHAVFGFIRKYAIQIGAMLNNIGMLTYVGHAWLERKSWKKILSDPTTQQDDRDSALDYINKGFRRDIWGVVLSLAGWTSLMIPRKAPKTSGEAKPSNIFAKGWEQYREKPEVVSGLLTLGASSLRLGGAYSKGNAIQKIGETIYIGGDIALMFTNNTGYGVDKVKDIEKVATMVEDYIAKLPVALGPQSEQEFLRSIANYMLEKNLAEGDDTKKAPKTRAELDQRAALLVREVTKKLHRDKNNQVRKTHWEKTADAVAALAGRFPESARPEVAARLVDTLSKMEWMRATPEELTTAIKESTCGKVVSPRQSKLVQMKDISQQIANLVFVVPGLDAGANALAIHDALVPFTRAQASDERTLHQAMDQKACEQLGIPVRSMTAALRAQSGAQAGSSVPTH